MSRSLTRWTTVVLGAVLTSGCASRHGAVKPQPFPVPPVATVDPATPVGPVAPPAPPSSESTRIAGVVQTALALEGAPYRNGGADPGGFDCSGFVSYVFGQQSVMLPRDVKAQFEAGRLIEDEPIAAGDLVFFATVAPGASHVGIALDPDRFIHAPSSKGKVRIERLTAPYWRSRYVGARRLLE